MAHGDLMLAAISGRRMLTVAARSGSGGTPAAVTDGGGGADMRRASSRYGSFWRKFSCWRLLTHSAPIWMFGVRRLVIVRRCRRGAGLGGGEALQTIHVVWHCQKCA